MFEPDQVTPAQFYGPVRADTGARRLLLAILDDAVHQLLTMRRTAIARREDGRAYAARFSEQKLAGEIAWFTSDEVCWGSFVYICQVLEIDPAWLRRKLLDPTTTMTRHLDSSRQPATRGAYRKQRRVVSNGDRIPTSDYYLTKGIRAGAEPMGRPRQENNKRTRAEADALAARIAELRAAGVGYDDICEELGITRPLAVYYHKHRVLVVDRDRDSCSDEHDGRATNTTHESRISTSAKSRT